MKVSELTGYIESIIPLAIQEDYDNCGLLIGDRQMEVSGVLITLDVTEEIMEEAKRKNCNLVISHHPLIFKGLKKFTGDQFCVPIVIDAIKNDIGIYAMHTNLDNAFEGLNKKLITSLGVSNPKILSPVKGMLCKLVTFCPLDHTEKVRQALFDAGAGHIGNYDFCSFNLGGEGTFRASDKANPYVGEKNTLHAEPETRIEVIFPSYLENALIRSLLKSHPYEEVAYDIYPLNNSFAGVGAGMIGDLDSPREPAHFLQIVKETVKIPVIRHSRLINRKIKKVAVCGGSGAFLLNQAKQAGADIFLTGDIRYHDFFEVRNDLILADIGHYESEQVAKEWIYSILKEKFPNFALLISEITSNPVNYF
jgi:dinuclear metal center YbgI/SA1388 family protein